MSKSFAMAGLRIGWLATRDRDLLARCAAFKDYTTICSAAPSEILALIGLRAREQVLGRSLRIVADNLAVLDDFFRRRVRPFAWVRPRGGSVAFPRLLGDARSTSSLPISSRPRASCSCRGHSSSTRATISGSGSAARTCRRPCRASTRSWIARPDSVPMAVPWGTTFWSESTGITRHRSPATAAAS